MFRSTVTMFFPPVAEWRESNRAPGGVNPQRGGWGGKRCPSRAVLRQAAPCQPQVEWRVSWRYAMCRRGCPMPHRPCVTSYVWVGTGVCRCKSRWTLRRQTHCSPCLRRKLECWVCSTMQHLPRAGLFIIKFPESMMFICTFVWIVHRYIIQQT